MAGAAADAGKHVLVEKPMATSLEDADAMIEAADRTQCVLVPAQNVRFAPPCLAAAAAMAERRIGDLVGVRAVLGHTGPDDWAPGSDWFFDREVAGGGALMDLGVHLFDLVRAVTGQEITVEACVLRHRPGALWIEDAAEIGFRMSSGAIGSLRASWDSTPPTGVQLTLVGTSGTIAVQVGLLPQATLWSGAGDSVALEQPEPVNIYAQFAQAAAGQSPVPLDGRDGRAALAAVLAGYAIAKGTP
jgi:predicted dehydrogenase